MLCECHRMAVVAASSPPGRAPVHSVFMTLQTYAPCCQSLLRAVSAPAFVLTSLTHAAVALICGLVVIHDNFSSDNAVCTVNATYTVIFIRQLLHCIYTRSSLSIKQRSHTVRGSFLLEESDAQTVHVFSFCFSLCTCLRYTSTIMCILCKMWVHCT